MIGRGGPLTVVLVLVLVVIVIAAGVTGAQAISADEGALFGSSDEQEEEAGETMMLDTSSLFDDEVLNAKDLERSMVMPPDRLAVEIGGSYRFSLTGYASWLSLDSLFDSPLEPNLQGVSADLGATVFLDVRPLEEFRVFGKADLSYPFVTDSDAEPPRGFEGVATVTELFSDFMVGDRLFLRGGKHTIAWGIGYFFSPADVLNLTAINPDDPEAEREGPVSLRAHLPIDFNNLYMYVIVDPTDDGVQLAVASRAEVVLGASEVGLGAYYHPDRVPRSMLTLSTSIAGYELFGEIEASLGSDRRFVEIVDRGPDNPFGLRTVRHTERVFTAVTGGLRYIYTAEDGWSATFVGQYLWNGEGYEDPDVLRDNLAGISRLMELGDLSRADLGFPGRHYAAASLNLWPRRGFDWSLGAFWISNLSDGSARVSPSITFRPSEHFSVRASATMTYGEGGAEMTPHGSHVGVSLTAILGSGRF